jgi:hypothetical protein
MDATVQEAPAVINEEETKGQKRKQVTRRAKKPKLEAEKKDVVHGYEDLDVPALRAKLASFFEYPGYKKWPRNPLVILTKYHEALEKKKQQKMDVTA